MSPGCVVEDGLLCCRPWRVVFRACSRSSFLTSTLVQVTIVVEAVKCMVGASVLFNYSLNKEYSINRLQDALCVDGILKN